MGFSRVTLTYTSSYPGVKKNPISETINSDRTSKQTVTDSITKRER